MTSCRERWITFRFWKLCSGLLWLRLHQVAIGASSLNFVAGFRDGDFSAAATNDRRMKDKLITHVYSKTNVSCITSEEKEERPLCRNLISWKLGWCHHRSEACRSVPDHRGAVSRWTLSTLACQVCWSPGDRTLFPWRAPTSGKRVMSRCGNCASLALESSRSNTYVVNGNDSISSD